MNIPWFLIWEVLKKWGSAVFKFFFTTRVGQIMLLAIAFWGYGHYQYHQGSHAKDVEWQIVWADHLKQDKDASDKAVATAKALAAQQEAIQKDLAKKLADEQLKHNHVKTIIQEVTKYVTPKADAHAVIPAGFVWVFNESAKADSGYAPFSTRPPVDVDAPTQVALSTVAGVAGFNNDECVARGELLDHWQSWYLKNRELWKKSTP